MNTNKDTAQTEEEDKYVYVRFERRDNDSLTSLEHHNMVVFQSICREHNIHTEWNYTKETQEERNDSLEGKNNTIKILESDYHFIRLVEPSLDEFFNECKLVNLSGLVTKVYRAVVIYG